MAAQQGIVKLQLRRTENSQPWGFRLRGGTDQGIPLHIEHVAPRGRAGSSGARPGDVVLEICGMNVQSQTHMQVKQEMLRCGNDLDLTVQRGTLDTATVPPPEEERVQIVEEPTAKFGGPTYKPIQTKTFQVLESELPASEEGAAPKPASIFDRKMDNRSDYLRAKGSTIQKVYGETK